MSAHVRPTLKALRDLPTESYDSGPITAALRRARNAGSPEEKRRILRSLDLSHLTHPLLDDARAFLENGSLPDPHKSSTRAAGSPIYEARDRGPGAAWRGAIHIERAVAWLVFADKHDRFHDTAAKYIGAGTWRPTALDEELAEHDKALRSYRGWERDVLIGMIEHLVGAALAPGSTTEFHTPTLFRPLKSGQKKPVRLHATVTFEATHDAPAPIASEAHTSQALIEVLISFDSEDHTVIEPLARLLAWLQVAGVETEVAYGLTGGLAIILTMTHARLAQLQADVQITGGDPPTLIPDPPTRLHYVSTADIARGFVEGAAANALCGVWFVPSTDASTNLPVCDDCERARPVAQALLDRLRS